MAQGSTTTKVTATDLDVRDLTSVSDSVSAVQSGTWNINNVSGTVSLPTGAATSAKQDTGNTSIASVDTNLTALTKAEDAAHSTGDKGIQLLTVRSDTAAATSGTDGDYQPLITDSAGKLHVNVGNTVTVGSHAVTNAGTFAVQNTAATPTGTNTIGSVKITDGTDVADILDLTNSNPVAVALVDTNGDQISSFGGGTQYTEDAAAAANPVGTALNLIRDDSLSGSLTTTDGDNVAARGNNKGELYVKHTDTIAVTQSGTWDEVGINDSGNSITVDYATTGSGTATGALRVELPTNGTGVIATVGAVTAITNALPAGTNAIGKLSANSGVDIGDVDVTSISAGDNTIGRVKLTDGTTVATVRELGTNDALNVAMVDGSGNQVTSFGGGTQYTEADTDASITGTAVMWEDTGDTLRAVSAAKPLPIGDAGGSLTIDGTVAVSGTVAVTQSGTWDEVGINDSGNSITIDYNGSAISTANALPIQPPASGYLVVNETGAALTALQLIDDTVYTDGTGTPSKAVGIAGTDGTNPQIIKTDTNGELQVDILSIAAGDNNIGNMDVASIAAGDNNIGNVDVVTVPSDPFGANADAAATAGSTGTMQAKLRLVTSQLDSIKTAVETLDNTVGGSELQVDIVSAPTLTVNSHAVTNAGTFAVQVDGNALTALQLIDDPVIADDAAFTPATTKVMMAGFEADETSTDSVDEGDGGAARMTLDRKIITTIQPHTSGGLSVFNASSSDGATALTNSAQAIKASAGQLYGWYIYNPNSSAQFVQLYNTAAASVTVGTTSPLFMLTIPATSAANVEFTNGITFSNAGWSCAATSTAGGNGAPTSALDAVFFYK